MDFLKTNFHLRTHLVPISTNFIFPYLSTLHSTFFSQMSCSRRFLFKSVQWKLSQWTLLLEKHRKIKSDFFSNFREFPNSSLTKLKAKSVVRCVASKFFCIDLSCRQHENLIIFRFSVFVNAISFRRFWPPLSDCYSFLQSGVLYCRKKLVGILSHIY